MIDFASMKVGEYAESNLEADWKAANDYKAANPGWDFVAKPKASNVRRYTVTAVPAEEAPAPVRRRQRRVRTSE